MMKPLLRIKAIALKEIRQLRRDKITFAMVVIIPLIQLLLFGYAINTDVRHIPVAVVDQSHSADARAIVQALEASQVVSVIDQLDTPAEAQDALVAGRIRAAVIFPVDLVRRENDSRPLGQWLVDGSDTMISSALLGLQDFPVQQVFRKQLTPAYNTFTTAVLFNPERRSAVNIVPALVAIILTMTMIMFTSAAIVRERERGNLEFLITTPVRPIELMVGKILPYMVLGLFQMALILTLGHVIFAVPINGSVGQIVLATLLFITASLTLGLLISTVAKSQLQSMQMTIFILLPSILLSGFMFPYEGMPVLAQNIAEILPATHFIRLIRGVVLRGAALSHMPYDIWWLGLFTCAGLIMASLKFKKQLD